MAFKSEITSKIQVSADVTDFIRLLYKYFDENGLKRTQLNAVFMRELIMQFKGVLIPPPVISELWFDLRDNYERIKDVEVSDVIAAENEEMMAVLKKNEDFLAMDMNLYLEKLCEKRDKLELEKTKQMKHLIDKEFENRVKYQPHSLSNKELIDGRKVYFEAVRLLEGSPTEIKKFDDISDDELMKVLKIHNYANNRTTGKKGATKKTEGRKV